MAWVMHNASPKSVIRVVLADLWTDLTIVGLLVYHGASKTVQVICPQSQKTRETFDEFFNLYGRVGKRALLETVQIRLANLTGTSWYESQNIPRHDTSIITERYTLFGSYHLSNLGQVGNGESVTIVDTEQPHVDRFDELFSSLGEEKQMERFYRVTDSPTGGSKCQCQSENC